MRRLSCDTCWFVHNSPFQIITFLHYHCSLKFDCIWGELEMNYIKNIQLIFVHIVAIIRVCKHFCMNLILFLATFWNYNNLWHTSMKEYGSIQILWPLLFEARNWIPFVIYAYWYHFWLSSDWMSFSRDLQLNVLLKQLFR